MEIVANAIFFIKKFMLRASSTNRLLCVLRKSFQELNKKPSALLFLSLAKLVVHVPLNSARYIDSVHLQQFK